MTKRFGFTLAEVLITLGIIGVVAALTMPTLMSSTQGAQYKAAYKKALSALNQMVTLNVALDDFNFAETHSSTETSYATNMYGMIKARMNVVKAVGTGLTQTTIGYTISSNSGATTADSTGTGNYTLFFNDGIAFSFPTGSYGCTITSAGVVQDGAATAGTGTTGKCVGFIDVNGAKPPNKFIKCTTGSGETCEVTNPTDVYPVVFYDQTLLPRSAAARAVLYGK
jgi:prepilin-type N-terminal cleavage/methylation domain-containing protein